MPVMTEEKARIIKANKRYKNAADALEINYPVFIRILNGFQNPPVGFRKRLHDVLSRWEREGNK